MCLLGSDKGSNHFQALQLFSLFLFNLRRKGIQRSESGEGRRPEKLEEGDAAAGHVPVAEL
jgi:hypothetical protein